jgi:hypothetical protein
VDDSSREVESYAAKSTLAHRNKGKRKISAEGRLRIAEAQQRRWAAKRASESTATKKTVRKSVVKNPRLRKPRQRPNKRAIHEHADAKVGPPLCHDRR